MQSVPTSVGQAPTPDDMPPLRLAAMDVDDLAVLSANLQDMQVRVGDCVYLPDAKRFAFVGKRFDWAQAAAGGCERCATGLHFDCVHSVSHTGFVRIETDRVLNLLAIEFETRDAPAGTVMLLFSGHAAIRLEVECLEAQMHDLGDRWPCACKPAHPVDDMPAPYGG